jgi:hypothetical protein
MTVEYCERGAEISGDYRYSLTRTWDPLGTRAVWVCLNPSVATEHQDDPTVRKVVGFSRRWGHGATEIVNLYAYRATDPADLARAGRPIGPENDGHIREALRRAHVVVCAWGAREARDSLRPDAIRRMLREARINALCLGRAKGGQPMHPLMLAYETPLETWFRWQT